MMEIVSEPALPRMAAVVLAAGPSARRFKPLLSFGGQPTVTRLVDSMVSVGSVWPIIVVTGHRGDLVAGALEGRRVRFIYDENYEQGEMLSSVRTGIRVLPEGAEAFFLALGEQPAPSPSTLRLLLEGWRQTRAMVVRPVCDGRRGQPLLLSCACVPDLLSLGPDETLRAFMHRQRQQMVEIPVEDPAVLADVDRPADYQSILGLWEQRSRPGWASATTR